jgi:hypothetical protein
MHKEGDWWRMIVIRAKIKCPTDFTPRVKEAIQSSLWVR